MPRAREYERLFGRRAAPPVTRTCQHDGCSEAAEHRAPRSRDQLDDYVWFCLAHVREYNAAWNYYAGMSERQIEAEIRRDTTWQRPSWPFGTRVGPTSGRWRDPFGFFADDEGEARNGRAREASRPEPVSPQRAALALFDLEPPFTAADLKARYKALVKLHHPDAHGGDKAAEERLKIVNVAYATLRATYFS